MDLDKLLGQARDCVWHPIELDGLMLIPVANIIGGFGGGDPRSAANPTVDSGFAGPQVCTSSTTDASDRSPRSI